MTAPGREVVLAWIAANPGATTQQVADGVGLALSTAKARVARLISRGDIRNDGARLSVVPPTPTDRPSLVRDERQGLFERRRESCALLSRCEWVWVQEHGGAQGSCPVACRWYRERGPDLVQVRIRSSADAGNVVV